MGGIQLKETIPKGEIRPTFSLYKIFNRKTSLLSQFVNGTV